MTCRSVCFEVYIAAAVCTLWFARPSSGQTGPDIIVGDIGHTDQLGRDGPVGTGIVGLGMDTTACNKGDQPGNWIALPNTDHPVILLNLYRLATLSGSDRFEQIGQSWLKHGFGSDDANECGFGCTPTAGLNQIGVGCSDTYVAAQFEPCGFDMAPLAPRSVIHPYTGAMPHGSDLGPGGGCGVNYPSANHVGHVHNGISHRLQVRDVDLMPDLNVGARYFGEGQYISRHEYIAGNGNQNNNVSHLELGVTGPDPDGVFTFENLSATLAEQPAVNAWPGSSQTPIEPAPLGDGRAFLAYKVTDLGGGSWHYEYAIYNMNMDRAIGSFSVPIPSGVTVSNVGFHAPFNHAPEPNADNYTNDPWSVSTNGGAVTWATDPYDVDPLANAVRFGTMYNFRFDADSPPQSVYATIGLFKTGGTVSAATSAPQPLGPQDCNNNGVEDTCDLDCNAPGCGVPGCAMSTDCDGTGVPDECEIDCNGNGVDDRCDVAGGGSPDCTGNQIPDECEPDCDQDGTADFCEIVAGTSADCNANGIPDECELARDLPVVCCPASSAPNAERLDLDGQPVSTKDRFLSIIAGDAGRGQAIRVKPVSLPSPFDIWDCTGGSCQTWYVGEPRKVCENAGQGSGVPVGDCAAAPGLSRNWFWAAAMVCDPAGAYITDWHGACVGGMCMGGLKGGESCVVDDDCIDVVHVYHEGVVPDGVYEIQVIDEVCPLLYDAGYSNPLTMTQAKWGDVVEDCTTDPCGPPNGVVAIATDVTAVLDKFKNLSGAPIKSRCDLAGTPPQEGELNLKVEILDVTHCLGAFTGESYSFGPGDPCK